jgi:hypothetical protein
LSVFCRAVAVGVVGPRGGAIFPAPMHTPKQDSAETGIVCSNWHWIKSYHFDRFWQYGS